MTTTGFSGLSRLMKAVVVVSLAANVMIVAALATAWHRHGGKHFHRGGVERSLMHFAHRNLPRERRKELRQAWRKERAAAKDIFQDMRGARKKVAEVLKTEPFDRAAFEAALETVWEKRQELRSRASKAFVDLVETLSPDEKKSFGAFLERKRKRWWHRRHGGKRQESASD